MSYKALRLVSVTLVMVSILLTGSASAAVSCPTITRTLGYNSKGADVSALQTYLASDKAVYPEGIVSGYFGRATEKAVQRFQASRKIVSSGTPASTGYGSVGARTRAALAACNSGAPAQTTPATTTPPTTALPVTTTAPVAVVQTPLVTFTDGATTTITLGAGTVPTITSFSVVPRNVDLSNDPVQMYWQTKDAQTCHVEKLNGSSYEMLNENVGQNGSVIIKVAATPSVYSLRCTGLGDNGTSTPASIRRDTQVRINNPLPSCAITTDKSSYVYAKDTIKISWTTVGADNILWEHGVATDPVALPFGNQYPNGSIFVSSIAGANQTVKLNISGYGGSASCSASFSIASAST